MTDMQEFLEKKLKTVGITSIKKSNRSTYTVRRSDLTKLNARIMSEVNQNRSKRNESFSKMANTRM